MKAAVLLIFLVVPSCLLGQGEVVRRKHYNIKNDIGVDGYDPVTYFEGGPKEGRETIKFSYKGVTYFFSSPNTLNKFKSDPDRYEPAYGGWCAYAMGEKGEKVKVDPETFKIVEGRLYLFYNFWGNNTLEDWNENEKKLKEAADRNWLATIK